MLRVGLIGAGNISRAHLFGYNRNSEVEVVAMSDINEELAKQRAETFGVKTVYTDYHDILNDKSIDAVSILTPVFTHKNVVIEALRAGKHVLCEKPPCLTAAEAQDSGFEIFQSMPSILYPRAENITVTCHPGGKVSQYCKQYGIPEV